ncbi:MAG TPA: FAD:protein FMN transferase [Solirubrobacteraceae bacterium]|jgi:thiamine biosynthesis lipoprotein|nr:FAD:protein FMN transferase [Solirubrobacteraceae bacterium]
MGQPEECATLEAFGSSALVAVTDVAELDTARSVVERTVADFDVACSRFRDDSELSAVNAAAGGPVEVGSVLIEAVTAALRAARLTGGDVDPTVGQALISLGYDRDFELVAEGGGDRGGVSSRVLGSVPGWRTVTVDPDHGTVRVAPGVVLDLGATAKALAADRAATAANAATGCGVLVSFGGDLAIAGAAPTDGWRIRVTDDHRSGFDAPGQWISLSSGGLATSSTAVRRWRTSSGTAHHLVDPATGRSADSVWRTVSVCAGNCLDANIASTASIIRGETAPAWLEEQRLPSRLVGTDGVARHVAGWPSEGDDL